MVTFRWNLVSGGIYLLITLFLLFASGVLVPEGSSVEWYTVVTIATASVTSAVFFGMAWLNRRRLLAERERDEEARPPVEPKA
ncbi:hypothetical protein [Microbacterium galbinum]|uniref:hypothetical protein n=1 Tax=Microbacterium galbinum TaxID=2851646 RepID=UPI001FFD7ADC|nr:hypothetical protein [Microbacterium galbinum]MCK2030936.1 hypothetical protein [Microbacterium galbinum]